MVLVNQFSDFIVEFYMLIDNHSTFRMFQRKRLNQTVIPI